MMKKLFSLLLITVSASSFAADFSGKYRCDAYDAHDGKYQAEMTLKLNKAYSKMDRGYASYDFSLASEGYPYSFNGLAAASGSNLAIYFESIGAKRDPSDKGVVIGTIITDQDGQGKEVVSMHTFYYEKAYKGKGNYGFENCVLEK